MHILSRILPLTLLFFSPSLASLAPSLEADQGNWTVEGCILVRMAAQVRRSGMGRDVAFTFNNSLKPDLTFFSLVNKTLYLLE